VSTEVQNHHKKWAYFQMIVTGLAYFHTGTSALMIITVRASVRLTVTHCRPSPAKTTDKGFALMIDP